MISIRHAFWLLQFNLTIKTKSRKMKMEKKKNWIQNLRVQIVASICLITVNSFYFKAREHASSWALKQNKPQRGFVKPWIHCWSTFQLNADPVLKTLD